ncbi:MAG: DNA polymerase [Brevinematia bacterium]
MQNTVVSVNTQNNKNFKNLELVFDPLACEKCPLKREKEKEEKKEGKTLKKVPWEINNKLPYEFPTLEKTPICHIVLVGEAPGHWEEKEGKPFVGKAGKLLREIINEITEENKELKLLNIMITNSCKCKPTDKNGNIRAPRIEEIKACQPNLKKDLELAKPYIIVALGKTAAQALSVPQASGKLEAIRGQIFDTKYGKVLVTYHPSAILRNNLKNVKTFKQDLQKAFEYALSCLEDSNKDPNTPKEKTDKEKSEIKYVFEKKVIKTDKELMEEYQKLKNYLKSLELKRKLKRENQVNLPIAIDFETIPFHWEYLPNFDTVLTNTPLSPFLGKIAFASVAYRKQDNGKNIIYSFSFPVKAKTYLDEIIQTIANKVQKLENNLNEITEKITSILENNEIKNKTLGLYFLYEEFGFSKDFIEEIIEEYKKDRKSLKVVQLLKRTITEYKKFLIQLGKFKKEVENEFSVNEEFAEEILKDIVLDERCVLIAQNPQFELAFIKKHLGIEKPIRGTDILDHLLGYNEHSLSELEKRYLMPLEEKKVLVGYTNKELSKKQAFLSIKDFAFYNTEDAAKTLAIYFEECNIGKTLTTEVSNSYKKIKLKDAIRSGNEFITSIVVPFAVNAHLMGIKIDPEKCRNFAEKICSIIENFMEKIREIIGSDIDNVRDDYFRKKLYELYEYEPIITPKDGKPSISESALKTIYQKTSNEDLKKLVLYVYSIYKYEGLLSRYVEKYPFYINLVTKRIHPWFNVVKTVSGRLSCKDPNIQQVPREPFASCPDCFVVPIVSEEVCPLCKSEKPFSPIIDFREVFIPEEGHLLVMADYSQIEMAILAELSKDEVLIDAINRGLDMHSYNASNVYKIPYEEIVTKKDSDEDIKRLRQNAKKVTFAVIYGATAEGIASRENLSVKEANDIINTFFEKHRKTKDWIEERHKEALKHGVVLVPTGRPRFFLKTNEKEFVETIKRRAQNTPIQGFASDINLITCELLRRKYGLKILGAIHDSIIAEIPEEKKELVEKTFQEAVSKTILLKECLKEELKLDLVPGILENLKVNLRIEIKAGKSWKEAK